MARMEDTRLPKCVTFGQMVGARAVSGASKKSGRGVSSTISELSASTPTSGRLQPSTRGSGAERQKKGRNISWRNGSLQRKPRQERTKKRIAQSKQEHDGSLALVD